MKADLWRNELVRLTAKNAQTDVEAFARWTHDSEYLRFQDSDVARPKSVKQTADWYDREDAAERFVFVIRPLLSDEPLGLTMLSGVGWHGNAWLGVGIGNRAYWGQGYGSAAVRLTLGYAFAELNLHRVSLSVLGTNPRAIRAYEKCGFVPEGRWRELAGYDGQWSDEVVMGILRSEWAARQTK